MNSSGGESFVALLMFFAMSFLCLGFVGLTNQQTNKSWERYLIQHGIVEWQTDEDGRPCFPYDAIENWEK